MAPARRQMFVVGTCCLLLVAVNTPAMLVRAGRAFQDPAAFGEPWQYWLAGAALNASIGAGGLGWLYVRMTRERSRLRAAAGLCRRCAYDLTANVSGVCPECGSQQ